MQGQPKDENDNSNSTPITSEHDRDEDVGTDGTQMAQSVQYQSIIRDLNTVTKFSQEWFQLKEQEISFHNRDDMKLDLIDGDDAPPMPVAMTTDHGEAQEKKVNENEAVRGIETIEDNQIPVPLSAQISTLEESDVKPSTKNTHLIGLSTQIPTPEQPDVKPSAKKAHLTGLTQLDDGDSPAIPTSFDQSLIDKQEKELASTKTGNGNLCDDESIAHPRREESTLHATTLEYKPFRNNNMIFPDTASSGPTENNIEMAVSTVESLVHNSDVGQQRSSVRSLHHSTQNIAEAYLVDDENVFIATPAEPQIPWWKQRRTKFLFGFVSLLLVAVLVISITVPRSQTITKLVALSLPPTSSRSPSAHPSSAPSLSAMPSSAPSACSDKIINNIRRIKLLQDNPTGLKAALDGRNLVLAWQKFAGSIQIKGSFYTAFYSLSDDGEWVSAGYFIESNLVWGGYDAHFDVAISGRTAVIGLPTNNVAYVYMQNSAGLWERTPSLQPKNQISDCGGFGVSVYICDNLIVVRDTSFCSSPARSWFRPSRSADYFFEQIGGEWKEIGMDAIDDNINYYYDDFEEDENAEEIISDIFAKHHMKYPVCLETNSSYFASLDDDGSISIYQKVENNTIPMFVQNLNASLYGDGFGKTFAMSQGVLVVGSDNKTHIFSRENADQWDEILSLHQSYESYELSGRMLIATQNGEVYSIDITECTPQIPTSTQSMPVGDIGCYPVNITSSFEYIYDYNYDDDVEESCSPMGWGESWEVVIQTDEFLESDSIIVKTLADDGSCGYTDLTTCLSPGRYRVNFLTNWCAHCYNLAFNFGGGSSSEQDFTFSGCNELGWESETALFDIPRTTLVMETPAPHTPFPTPPLSEFAPSPSPDPNVT